MKECICERCCLTVEKLYKIGEVDDDGKVILKNVCWDCDHDVSNGGDLFEDSWQILAHRKEEQYAYDPINTEKPF